jgi:hypothetical protein
VYLLVVYLLVMAALAVLAGVDLWPAVERDRGAGDGLVRSVSDRELRELERHLDRAAAAEEARRNASVNAYLARPRGHGFLVSRHRSAVALALSDGHLLTLAGVNPSTAEQIAHRAATRRLRPVRMTRRLGSYRLLLEDEGGGSLAVRTFGVGLTS